MTDRDNTGAIWKNEKRATDRHPHFTGQALIGGVEYWVSAWKREPDAKPNAPALRFSLMPKEQQKQESQKSTPPLDFDDDIPF